MLRKLPWLYWFWATRYNVPGGVLNWDKCAGLATAEGWDFLAAQHSGLTQHPRLFPLGEGNDGMWAPSQPSLHDLAVRDGALGAQETRDTEETAGQDSHQLKPSECPAAWGWWGRKRLQISPQVAQKPCVLARLLNFSEPQSLQL